jgi:acyl-CoA synthetase (AMP-forming)/AMP-acid ligase II
MTGEIYIGGTGVARGYRNRPALTAEVFVPNPFSTAAGQADARMYRTGDLGRLLPDGQIAFRGRVEGQETILGHRIETDEIVSVLQRHPGVASCAVVAITQSGEKRLASYVVPREGPAIELGELYEYLACQFPAFMVPSAFVGMRELPLNSNGKLDRSALPMPAPENILGSSGFRAAQSRIET